jgi:hypothetical protein
MRSRKACGAGAGRAIDCGEACAPLEALADGGFEVGEVAAMDRWLLRRPGWGRRFRGSRSTSRLRPVCWVRPRASSSATAASQAGDYGWVAIVKEGCRQRRRRCGQLQAGRNRLAEDGAEQGAVFEVAKEPAEGVERFSQVRAAAPVSAAERGAVAGEAAERGGDADGAAGVGADGGHGGAFRTLAAAPLEEPPVSARSPGCRQSPKSGFSPVMP